jgi:alginate O-acetyltransferase complex protein AlgI
VLTDVPFTSISFLVFFLVLLGASAMLSGRPRKLLLLGASWYFYMTVDWRFIGLLLLNTMVHYVVGRRIECAEGTARRAWLALGVAVTLGVLGYFKYAGFFVESLSGLLSAVGLNPSGFTQAVVLPLGISFFSFQALGYSIDVYRRKLPACHDPLSFGLFVGFFPQLLAGPIGRAPHLLPQWDAADPPFRHGLESGVALMLRGYLKKLLIAEPIALYIVDPAFALPAGHGTAFLLCGVVGFSFYLYLDFSGYTDIARGTARCFGYELMENFNRPYHAATVSNFWQRWHMSMSGFFRDYLFIALGGSRAGNVYLNLLLTFVGIGLWHGAGWNFVVYGALHGAMVGCERYLRLRRERAGLPAPATRGWPFAGHMLLTFSFVAFSRILFRAEDLTGAVDYVRAMMRNTAISDPVPWPGLLALVVAVALHATPVNWSDGFVNGFRRLSVPAQLAVLGLTLLAVVATSHGPVGFVYFQF